MFIPAKGKLYDTIRISDDEGVYVSSKVMNYDSEQLKDVGAFDALDVRAGNCFPFGSISDEDLQKVSEFIRSLHDGK